MNTEDDLLPHKINLETSRIHWKELERHFATGRLIRVSQGTDLVKVAHAISIDDTPAVSGWMDQDLIAKVSIKEARVWQKKNAELWAVVVKPWVLVQSD